MQFVQIHGSVAFMFVLFVCLQCKINPAMEFLASMMVCFDEQSMGSGRGSNSNGTSTLPIVSTPVVKEPAVHP